jgi:hypothetical protein
VVGQFHAAVPGQGLAELFGQPGHLPGQAGGHGGHGAVVEGDEDGEAGRSFDDGRDLRPVSAQQQVSFPVPGDGPILGLGRPFADRHRVLDLGPPLAGHGVVNVAPGRAPGAQVLLQLLGEHAAGLHEQRLVNRLV